MRMSESPLGVNGNSKVAPVRRVSSTNVRPATVTRSRSIVLRPSLMTTMSCDGLRSNSVGHCFHATQAAAANSARMKIRFI
jgi:hypothetical protein